MSDKPASTEVKIWVALVALAAGYAFALLKYHPNVVAVLQLLAGFCVLMFLVCAWFTWARKFSPKTTSG